VTLDSAQERALAVNLARFQEVLEQVARDGLPHFLCAYLFDLATTFMRFYEACPILSEADPIKLSRLLLCRSTASTLQKGLSLLGIGTVERM
jgi:arginyl-tRNA synthetase